jgi:2-polyprenyl-3-methyl-5-hydroxy-6-metoxy-1,4-benzoquinol methylase
MAPLTAPMAESLGAIVLRSRTPPLRVQDIAAGHGLFGIEIANQNPDAHVTDLDWASVLRVALDNARKAGVDDRYTVIPGIAFEVDFGGPYDTVLLNNFLQHFDVETCLGLLKKIGAALKPGGCCATPEFVSNEDRISPLVPAAFSLTILPSTVADDAHTFEELAHMYSVKWPGACPSGLQCRHHRCTQPAKTLNKPRQESEARNEWSRTRPSGAFSWWTS